MSWQAQCLNAYARLVIRRRSWGSSSAQLAARARWLFGAPPLWQSYAVRGLAVERVDLPSGVRGEWVSVPTPAGAHADTHTNASATSHAHVRGQRGVLMYVHGGGYVSCSAATHRPLTAALARATGMRVFGVDYRIAPETRFPGAFDDVVRAYHWLVTDGAPGEPVAVAGESAGGGLVLALAQHARDMHWPLPTCVAALSPWTDLAGQGASLTSNDGRCDMFRAENIPAFAAAYLGDASPHDPRASPVYGRADGLPPMLLQVGSREVLLDDAQHMHERVLVAGGASRLSVYPDMAHAWQLMTPFVPEATHAVQEIADFVRTYCLQALTTSSTAPRDSR